MNFLHVFSQGSPVLMAVFLLLMAMSFASWYIIFWKSLNLRNEYLAHKEFIESNNNIKDWPSQENFNQAKASTRLIVEESLKLQSVLQSYNNHDAKKEILTMHLIQALDKVRFNLDKGLTILASIGSSAPFIGLFGTVWGIYNALLNIASKGNANLDVVAGPMGEALVATAIGLFTAIPAVLAYNSFVRLNRLLVQNLRHIAEQITVYISNQNSRN